MRRCFVAIDVPEAVQDALDPVQEALGAGRLVDPEKFHITLCFLGPQSDAALQALNDGLTEISADAIEVQPKGLGTFGGRSPRVLWAGVAPNPALKALHDKVRSAARRAEIPLPRTRFRPHITLARFPERLEPGDLNRIKTVLERFESFPAPPFTVERVVLYDSVQHRSGHYYDPLATYAFSRNTLPAR